MISKARPITTPGNRIEKRISAPIIGG